ncbi:unnamed protein product [Sympodiomycopsis kandeliae]
MDTAAAAATTTAAGAAAAAQESISPALAELIANNEYVMKIIEHGPYGYKPNLWLPIIFASLYGLSALVHVAQVSLTKHWWLLLLVFACLAEAGGNGVRAFGHFKPEEVNPYMAQQIILVITPAFFAAIHYALLGRILELFGSQYTLAHFKPRAVTPIFVCLDLASLGIQGAGSGLAAVAEIDTKDTATGGTIVVIGLCVQLAAYLCFNLLLITFFIKASVNPNTSNNVLWTPKFKWFLAAFFLSSILVFCRSAFRTVEMMFGWIGPVSTVEWYYYAFDCAPVLVSVILLNLFHPGFVLPSNHREAVEEGRKRRESLGEKKTRGPRPRSSFYGGHQGDLPDEAEMKDVTVMSSSRNIYGGHNRSQPHYRTNSLASTAANSYNNLVTEKSHIGEFDTGFGWSHTPQRVPSARVAHHNTQQSHLHRKMEAEGFEPVSAPSTPMTGDDGFTPYVLNKNGAGSSTLSPSLYSQQNKSATSFMSEGTASGPQYNGQGHHVQPEVQVWRDDGDSTLVQSPSGSSWDHYQQPQSHLQPQHHGQVQQQGASPFASSWDSTYSAQPQASSSAAYPNQFQSQPQSQANGRATDRQSKASEYAYAM